MRVCSNCYSQLSVLVVLSAINIDSVVRALVRVSVP